MTRVLAAASILGALLAASAGSAHAGGGLFVPPLRAELGSSLNVGPSGPYASADMSVGIHWASLSPRESAVDLGIGITTSMAQDPSGGAPARASKVDHPTIITATGGYLELAARVRNGRRWRTWLGGRGELASGERNGRSVSIVGASARLSTELFGGVAGAGSSSIVLGTFAIGVYVEAKHREYGDGGLGSSGFGAGVSARLPLILVGT